jgi:hypothetical protein
VDLLHQENTVLDVAQGFKIAYLDMPVK